jgi:hypothetical protein
MAERESIKDESLERIKFTWPKQSTSENKKQCRGESYIFLVLPPLLSTIPWECMPVFTNALVSRVPSIYTLEALRTKHKVVSFLNLADIATSAAKAC